MPADLDHDLLARLRAADPAADLAHVPPAGGRHALVVARRRHAGSRIRRTGVVGGALAAAGVSAVAVVPTDGPGGGSIVVRAAVAAEPDPGSILRVTSEVDVRASGTTGIHQRKTTWVRVGPDGRPLDVRTLVTEARGDGVAPVEEVTSTTPDGPIFRSRELPTGRIRTERGTREVPSVIFQAHEMLEAARAGRGDVEDAGTAVVAGREVRRLIVTGVQGEPSRAGDRTELLVDAATAEPVALRRHSEGTDVHGRHYTYDLEERVLDQAELPDDAAHRPQLEMQGPVR